MGKLQVVIRNRGDNPNHHLYLNNGTWWVHYTVHLPDYSKKRVRQSLKTKSESEARTRRDALFRELEIRALKSAELEPLSLAA
jgi:hypothetical protein